MTSSCLATAVFMALPLAASQSPAVHHKHRLQLSLQAGRSAWVPVTSTCCLYTLHVSNTSSSGSSSISSSSLHLGNHQSLRSCSSCGALKSSSGSLPSSNENHSDDDDISGSSEGASQESAAGEGREAEASEDKAGVEGGRSGEGAAAARAQELPLQQQVEEEEDWRSFRAKLVASERAFMAEEKEAEGSSLGAMLATSSASTESGTTHGEELEPSALSIDVGPLWAHPLPHLERGCVLVATEELDSAGIFAKSVVLMLSVGGRDDEPYGIILNKPLGRYLSDVMPKTGEPWERALGACEIHNGGPIGRHSAVLLHGCGGVEGHEEVLPGVFMTKIGGMHQAARLVLEGKASAEDDFRFIAGCAAWGNEQLEEEVRKGLWTVAACSGDVVLKFKGRQQWWEILSLCTGVAKDADV